MKNIHILPTDKPSRLYEVTALIHDAKPSYKIIIPKEEPKQIKCYCGHTTYCDCGPLEEPKQETLKEAKQRILDSNYITKNDADVFEMGVKWQQERSYSEEEVVDLLAGFSDFANTKEYVTFKAIQDWFEQFKKK